MRIQCPICGSRDRREFYYRGAYLARPDTDEASDWDDYLHKGENPAGGTEELWYHESGCGAWVRVRRVTRTHEVLDVTLAEGAT
jgi:sarcosine oxidase subunit delta